MVRGKGIGGHTAPNKGEFIIWLTPPEILHFLGEFDLDPCAAPSPRPWPTAARHIELPEDGLLLPWTGRVWLNPPYDESTDEWMKRMASHGSGIALIFARTEIEIWQKWVWPCAHSILFIAGRLTFRNPDGSKAAGNAGGPSALIAYSRQDTEVIARSGIAGGHVRLLAAML